MRQVLGNLWDELADVHVITTNGYVKSNGACVMGRGCAREARDAFPGLDLKLGSYLQQHGNRPFHLGIWSDRLGSVYRLATFPTKHVWSQQSDLALIHQSAIQLVEMADKFGWEEIVMPRPGCGNGGLVWADVFTALVPVLDDRFKVITHDPGDARPPVSGSAQ
jgi:hypothetical protein